MKTLIGFTVFRRTVHGARRWDRLSLGVTNGLKSWLWYGVAEYVLCSIVPVLFWPYAVVATAQWRGTAELFVCYGIIGAILGAGSALCADRHGRLSLTEFSRRSQALLILTVIVAFSVNLATTHEAPGGLTAIVTAWLIGGVVVWSVWRTETDHFFGSPAVVSAILIVSAKLACGGMLGDWPAVVKAPLTMAATLALIGAAVVAIRLTGWLRLRTTIWSPAIGRSFAVMASVALVFYPGIRSSNRAVLETAAPLKPAAADRPNIILITADTVRADHMGVYGYARKNTPNLAALLSDATSDATLYTHAAAASPLTLTSHASMFTGLYPHSHGAFIQLPEYPRGRPLPAGIPTLADILSGAGYNTMAVAANRYYLLPEWGLLRGFQYLWTPRPVPVINSHARRYVLRNGLRKLLNIDGVAHDFDRDTVSAEEVNRAAFARLADARERQTPFFLFLNYMDAHLPYLPPTPFDTMYPGRDRRFASWEYDQITKRVNEGSQRLEPHEWAHLVSQYDGAIAYIDYALGELVRYLKRSGQYDRTMIVITSDHGEALGERGLMGHNVTLYQDQVHVALVIKYPRPAPSRVIDDLASQIDLLPTVLEVAGLPAPPGLPGTSLLHLAAAAGRTVMSERHGDPPVAGGGGQSRIQYAALSGFSKLICSPAGEMELYDLSADPNERRNLYRPDAPSALALNRSFQEWLSATPRHYSAQAALDGVQYRRLKSLGYLQ